MVNMREIGVIKAVQIQRSTLKVGERLARLYDPAALLVVERLLLAAEGAIGVTGDGALVMDLHHVDHPDSHNSAGNNGISLGFTSHYRAMRERFGKRLVDGCAGENILIETDGLVKLEDFGGRVAIRDQDRGQFVYLTNLKVAAPCVEFSHYAAGARMGELLAQQLKETLQFLNEGTRGYYATATNEGEPVAVRAGDRVFVG